MILIQGGERFSLSPSFNIGSRCAHGSRLVSRLGCVPCASISRTLALVRTPAASLAIPTVLNSVGYSYVVFWENKRSHNRPMPNGTPRRTTNVSGRASDAAADEHDGCWVQRWGKSSPVSAPGYYCFQLVITRTSLVPLYMYVPGACTSPTRRAGANCM